MKSRQARTYILGISAWYHDSAAVLLADGEIVAAVQEERFTRLKNDAAFPDNAVTWCLEKAGIAIGDVSYIAFYDKPFLKFERLLETALFTSPRWRSRFSASMPLWVKEKLFIRQEIRSRLKALFDCKSVDIPKVLFTSHHRAHAASAFYSSPYSAAAVLCLDGVGEWESATLWRGEGNRLQELSCLNFPHSLGLLYSAFTWYCGFRVNSGEYKLMGLAPYGVPRYAELIERELICIKADGSFRLNMDYFDYWQGDRMANSAFADLFGGPARPMEGTLTQREMDIAASIQQVLEGVVVKMAQSLRAQTQLRHLCMAGGVALNCVANRKVLERSGFDDIWVQPASGDAGGALGAAQAVWFEFLGKERTAATEDSMQGALLGPAYEDAAIRDFLEACGANFTELNETDLYAEAVNLLEQGEVLGWFQGRSEFGPRSLGNRSILADSRSTDMQSRLNLKIKFRESFRPFAPAVAVEHTREYFDFTHFAPYMTLTAALAQQQRLPEYGEQGEGLEQLKVHRSLLPAVTHVDYSARLQTVSKQSNAAFHRLLTAFGDKTGCYVLVNTSFNVRGEPIVQTPADAWRCFLKTDMDALVLGRCLLRKSAQADTLLSGESSDRENAAAAQFLALKPVDKVLEQKNLNRKFGWQFPLMLMVITGCLSWFAQDPGLVLKCLPVSCVVFIVGLFHPQYLNVLRRGWLALGRVLGRIISPLVLAVLFYVLICPMGFIYRRLKGAMVFSGPDEQRESYFEEPLESNEDDFYRPF